MAIFNFFDNMINDIKGYIDNIFGFVASLKDFITFSIDLLPNEFKIILMIFLGVFSAILLLKVVRG